MKLHAFDRERAMSHAHDLAVFGLRRHDEAFGYRHALDYERVIARRNEIVGNAGKDPLTIVADTRHLAMHDLSRAHHFASECLADRLMTEADAENRNLSR